MKTSTVIALAAFLLLLLAIPAAFFAGRWTAPKPDVPAPQIDTIWMPDTTKLTDSKPAGSIIVPLPVVRPSMPDTAGFANNLADSANLFAPSAKDTVRVRDTVLVEVPIEEKTYEGENYKAVVKGFQPELVSIDIKMPQCPTSLPAPKRKWWSVTVGPQVGYGFTPAGWQPYAGIGVSVGFTF